MNIALLKTIQDANAKFGAYYGLLDLRYKNLCVKSDGTSLLSARITNAAGEMNIEDAASVTQPNDYQLAVFPNDEMYLQDIVEGVFEAHPEFKMQIMVADENGAKEFNENDADAKNQGQKYLLYTMPEVNKERYDFLNDGVKGLHKECKSKVEIVNFDAKQQLVEGSFISTQKDMDDANDKLEQVYEKTKEMVDELLEKKLEEIEEGYKKWQEDEAKKNESSDYDVIKSFRMTDE